MAAATGNNEVLGLGQDSGFGFLESASETSHLGGLLHEKVKEKLQSIWFIRQAWSCLYVLSSFQALHLQYVFTYIIGITSRLVPLSISTKPCGLHDSKITPQIPCLFQRTYM